MGKIVFIAGQFAQCLALSETLVLYIKKNNLKCNGPHDTTPWYAHCHIT